MFNLDIPDDPNLERHQAQIDIYENRGFTFREKDGLYFVHSEDMAPFEDSIFTKKELLENFDMMELLADELFSPEHETLPDSPDAIYEHLREKLESVKARQRERKKEQENQRDQES